MPPGYYRDSDSWLYLTSEGNLYLVNDPAKAEPVWRAVGLPLSEDAEPKLPGIEELAAFEGARTAYGIAA